MDFFLHTVDMPFSGSKIVYKELNCKQLLSLNKLNLNLPYQKDCIEDYSKLFLEIISDCVKNKQDLLNLNLIEYLMFVTKLRISTLGDIIEISSKEKTENSSDSIKKIKFEFNLSQFIEKLFNIGQELNFIEPINTEDYDIELDWPIVKREFNFLKEKKEEEIFNTILETIPFFIKQIKFIKNNKIISFKDLTNKEILKLYNNLSIKIQRKIQNIVFKNLESLNNYNIWDIESLSEGLNLYNGNYQNLLRIFFEENLNTIYEDYYVLASKNITPEYQDQMSIADKKMFVTIILKEIEAEKEKSNPDSVTNLPPDSWGNFE